MADQKEEAEVEVEVAVMMVPIPEHCSLDQFLHLSRLISAYNIPIHFVGNTTHTPRAKRRVQCWSPSNVHFHEYPTTISPSPHQTYINAASELRQPVAELLRALGSKWRRVVVIHDPLMSSAVQDVVSLENAESYIFQSISAFSFLAFNIDMKAGSQDSLEPDPAREELLNSNVDASSLSQYGDFVTFVFNQLTLRSFNSGNLFNTCKIVEGPYIDTVADDLTWGHKLKWNIGPVNPVMVPIFYTGRRHKCLKWLDKQEMDSVIYVCFGTTTSLSQDQIKELALGLQKSNHKFIWVLREADKSDVFDDEEMREIELPKGYEKKMMESGMGMVVRDWAPQMEILGHPSVGGFMSHCGWNSCMESISMGVPIAAWPMDGKQRRNSILVTRALQTGIMVKENDDELVKASAIEEAVIKLMGSTGDERRKSAEEIGVTLQLSVLEENGEACIELHSFIAHITR